MVEPCIPLNDLRVPIHVVKGHFEKLTEEQLDDHYYDIYAERERRCEG